MKAMLLMITVLLAGVLIAGWNNLPTGQTNQERRNADREEGRGREISYRASFKVIEVDENTTCVVTLDHHTTPTAIDCDWRRPDVKASN